MFFLLVLFSIISPVTFAASAWDVEAIHSDFDFKIDARQQILNANHFSDIDVITNVVADTGQLIIAQQDFVFPLRGHFIFPLHRLYSREFKQSSSIGFGWRWAFDLSINKVNDEHIEFLDFDGQIYKFIQQTSIRFENNTTGKRIILKTSEGYIYTHNLNRYRFNSNGNLLDITDPSGNIIKLVYQNKRLEKINLYDEAEIKFKYDKNNKLIQTQLPSGGVINYRYSGELITDIFDQYENHLSYQYDGNNLSTIKQADKNLLEVTEDIDKTTRSISLKTIKSYEYAYQHKLRDVDQFDFTVTKISQHESVAMLYSCKYQECSRTNYAGETATINWHNKFTDLPVLFRSAQGRETQWQYNQNAKLVAKSGANKAIVRYEYDDRQWLKTVASARGTITAYLYTDDGLLSQITRSGVKTNVINYNENGLIESMRNPNNQLVTIQYNADALPVGLQFNLVAMGLHYDTSQRITQIDINNDPASQLVYNNADRSISYKNLITQKSQQIVYLNSGLPASLSMQKSGDLDFEYNANNKLVFIKNPNKNLHSFNYDHFDRLKTLSSAAHSSQGFEYDSLGRLIQITNEAGAVIGKYSYDNDGLITEQEGIEKTRNSYKYDSNGRLREVLADGLPILEVDYNADNFLVLFKRGEHEIKYLRDHLNRIKLMRIKAQPGTDYRDYEFEWNSSNEMISLRYPSGRVVDYDYDAFGRTPNLNLNLQSITKFNYEGTAKLRLDSGSGLSSMDALEFSKKFNTNQYQAENPLSALMDSDCNSATHELFLPQIKFIRSIIDLPILTESRINNCHNLNAVNAEDLLQEPFEIAYANPQTLFKKQITDDIDALVESVGSILPDQLESTQFDKIINFQTKKLQSDSKINSHKATDDNLNDPGMLKNTAESGATNSTNKNTKNAHQDVSQPQTANKPLPEQIKPQAKRIYLTPSNE